MDRRRARAVSRRTTVVVIAVGACLVAIIPFYWMLRTALAPSDEVFFRGISLLPSDPSLDSFRRAWTEADLGRAMLNGLIVAVGILLAQLLTCIPAAYALSKLRFPYRNVLFGVVLTALLVPFQATAIPNYIGLSQLGVIDTRASLVLPFLTSAFGIFIIRQYMTTVPDALIEAARMDGLGHWQILWRVVAPISLPAILTFSLFSIFVHWNDYLWPLLVARSPELHTPPLALAVFQNDEVGSDFGALAAGATIVTLPIVVLFVLTRRHFVAGLAGGEIVG